MPSWLVITAEHPHAGRGVRGRSLVQFLRTYFGRRDVAVRSPRWALRTRRRADTLLVGLPTSLTDDELRALADRTRCRRAHFGNLCLRRQGLTGVEHVQFKMLDELPKPIVDIRANHRFLRHGFRRLSVLHRRSLRPEWQPRVNESPFEPLAGSARE